MYNNEFFVVDMASCTSTGEIINSLSLALETLNHSGKRIVLKLNDSYLNQSQMLSIQSLITSYGCILDTIETINPQTVAIAENMNILVQKPIEQRVEENYEQNQNQNNDFQQFNMNVEEKQEGIPIKDSSELHFEADLDAIKNRQEEINNEINNEINTIPPVMTDSQINPEVHFEELREQIQEQIAPMEEIHNAVEEFRSETQAEINSSISVMENTDEFANAEKNSIGVYKKAYDEEKIDTDQWEEVDFYETPTNDPVVSDSKNTTYVNQTLRSGQILESDGNVVIIGDCHPGSEIRAVGDVTVWGVLSGIAHAGCKGNLGAKVRALKLNAVQLRIGNCYSRRPDGNNIPYIIKSSIFTPEEARVVDGEIMLFKINQN